MFIPSVWSNIAKRQTEGTAVFFKIRIAAALDFLDGVGCTARNTLLHLFNYFDWPCVVCHLPVLLPHELEAFLENISNEYFGRPFFNLGSIYNMGRA